MSRSKNWRSDPNKKAIGIVRRSSHGQKDNTSAASQARDIKRYCDDERLDLVAIEEIVESAWKANDRTKHKAIKKKAAQLGAKNLVYHKDDRDNRNLTDTENNEEEAKAGKFNFHYVTNRLVLHEYSPDSDFLMREYHAIQNKHYSRDLSTKVKRAQYEKAESGWWPYRHTTLGYFQKSDTDRYGKAMKGTAKLTPVENTKIIVSIQRIPTKV